MLDRLDSGPGRVGGNAFLLRLGETSRTSQSTKVQATMVHKALADLEADVPLALAGGACPSSDAARAKGRVVVSTEGLASELAGSVERGE